MKKEYSAAGIVICKNEGKLSVLLIKDRFGKWTWPKGHIEKGETPQEAAEREIKEEVGLEVNNIEYVTSLATVHKDGNPSLVISAMADYVSGDVTLQPEETDKFAWVSLEEAKDYDLIDGIYDELVMTEDKRKDKQQKKWQRH